MTNYFIAKYDKQQLEIEKKVCYGNSLIIKLKGTRSLFMHVKAEQHCFIECACWNSSSCCVL